MTPNLHVQYSSDCSKEHPFCEKLSEFSSFLNLFLFLSNYKYPILKCLKLDSHRFLCTFSFQTFVLTKLTFFNVFNHFGESILRLQTIFITKSLGVTLLVNKLNQFKVDNCLILWHFLIMFVNTIVGSAGRHWYHSVQKRKWLSTSLRWQTWGFFYFITYFF